MKSLEDVLAQFTLFQKVLDRPEVLERVAFEVVEDCYREGTRKVELRFAPHFVAEYSQLHWDEILLSFEMGLKRALAKYPDMRAGLLCIAVRDFGTEGVARAVEFFLAHQTRFAGLDLAGNEAGSNCKNYERDFKKAIQAQAKITIHAGEAAGPENIWEAIEYLGAQRIGHGIAAVQDLPLVERIRRDFICLEMCPTSNWLTQAVLDLKKHPISKALELKLPVCINTDDPTIFGTTLPNEVKVSKNQIGLTQSQIDLCFRNADQASFLS